MKARENYLPVKEAYEREFRLFLDTQAGILAEGLKREWRVRSVVQFIIRLLQKMWRGNFQSVDQKKAAADEAEKRSEIAVQWQAA